MPKPYTLKISRRTVDKLGVKLYDRVALVIAEMVSNAYDADAKRVTIKAPIGEFLATRKGDGKVEDKGYMIEISDPGIGMTPDELQKYYLVVGSDRRADRGDTSPGGRPVTGRKGVGKLAPFGICRTIEVISAGGESVKRGTNSGYVTAHIIMRYDDITSEDETEYEPTVGDKDRSLSPKRGTTVILRDFLTRKVPDLEILTEELAQRFGLDVGSNDWKIQIQDNRPGASIKQHTITPLDIPRMPKTTIEFNGPRPTIGGADASKYAVEAKPASNAANFKAGFTEGGRYYPIVGWIAFAKEPVKHEYHAGVRVYCRKKFAAQTGGFNIASGFTGELNIKSYLIGELHCDWLDQDEDLIHTDRQSILWSTDIGVAFQDWGRGAIKELARLGRKPAQERTVEIFKKTVDLDARLNVIFAGVQRETIRKRASDLALQLAKSLRPDEAADDATAEGIVELAVAFAPHAVLSDELRRASESDEAPTLGAVASILSRARFAESMTLGAVVKQRLQLIAKFKQLISTPDTDEADVQKLLEQAPWLIRPEWTPITENKSLKVVREALEAYLSKKMKTQVTLSALSSGSKRPDFVMISGHGLLELVEIKKPQYGFGTSDLQRLYNYVTAFDEFFDNPANRSTLDDIKRYRITLVCDQIKLKAIEKGSFENLKKDNKLEHTGWSKLVKDTVRFHESFIEELEALGGADAT